MHTIVIAVNAPGSIECCIPAADTGMIFANHTCNLSKLSIEHAMFPQFLNACQN